MLMMDVAGDEPFLAMMICSSLSHCRMLEAHVEGLDGQYVADAGSSVRIPGWMSCAKLIIIAFAADDVRLQLLAVDFDSIRHLFMFTLSEMSGRLGPTNSLPCTSVVDAVLWRCKVLLKKCVRILSSTLYIFSGQEVNVRRYSTLGRPEYIIALIFASVQALDSLIV
jgi:hypothetical protein